MISKKRKAAVAALLIASMTASAVMPTAAAVEAMKTPPVSVVQAPRTIDDKYGSETYAQRFMSLYDDVMTKGVDNGYLSKNATGMSSNKFGVPYHSRETMIVEAPDYGHETTSEAMSYITWIAAMHDNLAKNYKGPGAEEFAAEKNNMGFADSWKVLEVMIPTKSDQPGWFGYKDGISADQTDEYQDPSQYPPASAGVKVENPLYATMKTAYQADGGYYLLHWLADVDNWYGYGGSTARFTYINSFQRGEQESCWETVPHPAIEDLKGTKEGKSIKGVFQSGDINKMWAYTNAPDAEDRSIQSVYWANKWGVGSTDVSGKAGKMSDQLRNDMFDKYYKEIGDITGKRAAAASTKSQHYLMAWYTSWGGADQEAVASYGGWGWQIGASHMHEFYQNPMAAYAKVYDSAINAGMKSNNATKDWETSLERQIEFYEWLQSAEGPFAGGATNSFLGRYEAWTATADCVNGFADDGPVNKKTDFYGMYYLPHPVYMDPGSNHWIGNQVWAVQRLAELYYVTKSGTSAVDKDLAARLKVMLDKWVKWAVNEAIEIDESEVGFQMAENLNWRGQPETWNGKYQTNSDLHAVIRDWANGDIGVVASMANTLIYYAVANGVDGSAAHNEASLKGTDAEKGLYLASYMLDRLWAAGRDDVGIVALGSASPEFIHRFFTQKIWVPQAFGTVTTNTGGIITGQGASAADISTWKTTFMGIRPQYKGDPKYASLEADYNAQKAILDSDNFASADETKIDTTFEYHRFWHEGDVLMALGAMAEYFPDEVPAGETKDETPPVANPTEVTVAADGGRATITVTDNDTETSKIKAVSADEDIATVSYQTNGTFRVTGENAGSTTITFTDKSGNKTVVKVTVTNGSGGGTTTTPKPTTTTATTTKGGDPITGDLLGDVDLNGEAAKVNDIVVLAKYLSNPDKFSLSDKAKANAQCDSRANAINTLDLLAIIKYSFGEIEALPVK